MVSLRLVFFVGVACVLVQEFGRAEATSYRITKEQEAAIKVQTCKDLAEEQVKMPAKFQQLYDHIQNTICTDPNSKYYDAENYLTNNLNKDEYLELRIIRVGKEKYCNYILGLSRLYGYEFSSGPIERENITTPEYFEFKNLCDDSTATAADITPLAQALQKIYHHF